MKDKIIESYIDLGAKGAGYDTARPMAAMNPNPKVVKKKKK